MLAARDRAVLAATLDPIVTIDERGAILFVSDSIERVFGWRPSELLGRNVSVLMPEPVRSDHDGHLARYARTGRTAILGRPRQMQAVRRDGSLFPVELCVSRADLPRGVPIFVGIIRDITEQVRLNQELAARKRTLETLIAHMPDIVFRLDHDLRHVFIGGAVHRISPLNPQQFIGRSGRDLGFPTALCDRFEQACRRVLKTMRPAEVELEVDGIWILHRLTPEFAADGSVESILGLAEDVTQRKHTEAELSRHRRQLEQIVAERTEELRRTHEQIRLADRMASIGTLAAGLGHDLNNVLLPVRAQLNAARQAAAPPCDPRVRRLIRQVERSIEYLQQLADGLHYLAIDPERTESEPTEHATDLARWWSQTGTLLTKTLPGHVRVEVDWPSRLPPVRMAPHRLTQAVLNLVVNAGQAMPPMSEGRGRAALVRVFARREPAAASGPGRAPAMVRLCVQDNGVGMTPEVRRRAFELFFTTKTRGMGTGLGLPLVARVVEDVGGRVELESTPGRGTCVSLLLPAAASSANARRQALSAALAVSEPRVRSLLAQLLRAASVEVTEKKTSEEARIWIVDPLPGRLRPARDWLGRRSKPSRVLVLTAPPPDNARAAWLALKPIIIDDAADLVSIRSAVLRAVQAAQPEET